MGEAAAGGALQVAADTTFRLGDWDAADALALEAIQVAGDVGLPAVVGWALIIRARILAARDHPEESRAVAQKAVQLLKTEGLTAAIDGCRGLDHGAWAPLLYMYPDADVPVVQLAVQPALGPRHHLGLGRALRSLADEGILIMGSGHMTHNLRDWARGAGQPQPYATNFQQWVKDKIEAHDYDSLADYRSLSADGMRSHPTDEHFLPLFVALGAAPENTRAEQVYDDVEAGVLAMDAYLFN